VVAVGVTEAEAVVGAQQVEEAGEEVMGAATAVAVDMVQ